MVTQELFSSTQGTKLSEKDTQREFHFKYFSKKI